MKILEISLARQMGGGDKALGHNNHHDYLNEPTSQLRRELVAALAAKPCER
jgi:hypothetical protein